MVATFRGEIAGYQRLPEPVVLGQIFQVSRRNVELFFRSIIDGREVTEDDLSAFRESAKDRAAEGMPLEDLLHAYRLGGRLGWEAIMAAAQPEEEHALLMGAELLMRYVDRVSSAVAQAYLEERQHLVSEEERRLRLLVDALVGRTDLHGGPRELAERLGFPIEDRYRPFAQTVPGAPVREHARIAAALRGRGLLALTEGDRVAGLAPPATATEALGEDRAVFAIGEPTSRAELDGALEEVRLLVDLGRRLGRIGRIESAEFLPELLLASSPRLAAQLRDRVLGPLEEYGEKRTPDLLETLDAFVEDGLDRRATAKRMHIHPNTLDYRLRRIAELTGLDMGRPQDLLLATLALKQRSLS
jgi:hypothetical protein